MQLNSIDWIVIALYFLFNLAVGFYLRKRATQSVSDFFVSGRNVTWWLAGTSMVATTFAADTPLVVSGLVARNGIAGNWIWWSMAFSGILTVFFYAKLWRRAGVLTDVEFAEIRYSGKPAAFLRGVQRTAAPPAGAIRHPVRGSDAAGLPRAGRARATLRRGGRGGSLRRRAGTQPGTGRGGISCPGPCGRPHFLRLPAGKRQALRPAPHRRRIRPQQPPLHQPGVNGPRGLAFAHRHPSPGDSGFDVAHRQLRGRPGRDRVSGAIRGPLSCPARAYAGRHATRGLYHPRQPERQVDGAQPSFAGRFLPRRNPSQGTHCQRFRASRIGRQNARIRRYRGERRGAHANRARGIRPHPGPSPRPQRQKDQLPARQNGT